MENSTPEPEAVEAEQLPAAPALPKNAIRHDGWDGEAMAIFCETLADTAVVAEACEAARKSTNTAYALRRRNPFFAAAWDAALAIARERLADTLLARSVEGNIEQIWRDGELVGERHVIDNRLGLAILRRLDRLSAGEMPGASRTAKSAPAPRPQPFDWEMMLAALRSGAPDDIAAALALVGSESDETREPHDPPFSLTKGDSEPEEFDLSDRCWRDEDKAWMTDFPPPAGFTGYQSCDWGDPDIHYKRECTPEEVALLEADAAAARAAARAEEETLRERWFALLKEEQGDSVPSSEERAAAAGRRKTRKGKAAATANQR